MPNLTAKEAAEGLKLLPCGYMLEHKALGPKTKDASHEVRWVLTRQNGKTLGYVKSKVVNAFVAAMNAPDPQLQVLQLALAEAEGALTQLSLSTTANRGSLKQAYDQLDLYNAISRAALETIAKVKAK
jgi:hypothetical protein